MIKKRLQTGDSGFEARQRLRSGVWPQRSMGSRFPQPLAPLRLWVPAGSGVAWVWFRRKASQGATDAARVRFFGDGAWLGCSAEGKMSWRGAATPSVRGHDDQTSTSSSALFAGGRRGGVSTTTGVVSRGKTPNVG